MNVGFHHLLYKYKYKDIRLIIQNPGLKTFIDRGVYVCGFLGVVVILPQIVKIWVDGNSSGVSLTTWAGFLIASSFWLFYGIIHQEKPIILTNIGLIAADMAVVIGILVK